MQIPENDIVISPRRNKNEKEVPEEGILLVNPTEAEFEINLLKKRGAESRFLFNSNLYLQSERKFIAGPAIGAPMAVLTIEKLIALGAKRIILFGWCGAIDRECRIGDVLLPETAISGEGTSRYYREAGVDARVHDGLRSQLMTLLEGEGELKVHSGRIWSTDAVYRESRSQLKQLHDNEGVTAVDMEFSALCNAAAFRGVEFAAVLIVSDEIWGNSWRPGFSSKVFKGNAARVRKLLIENQIGA